MSNQRKSRRVGRPKLPKGKAKGRTVSVRFTADDWRAMEAKAKAAKQSLSEWIRSTQSEGNSNLGRYLLPHAVAFPNILMDTIGSRSTRVSTFPAGALVEASAVASLWVRSPLKVQY